MLVFPGTRLWRVLPAEKADGRGASEGWRDLLGAANLGSWRVLGDGKFSRAGSASLEPGHIALGAGENWTGVAWTGEIPRVDYEVVLEARRTTGETDFCDILFPVGSSHCILAVGTRGGLVGLSIVDGEDVEKNLTTTNLTFASQSWYQIRLRVTRDSVEAWVDQTRVVSLDTRLHRVGVWDGFDPLCPFGVCTWRTAATIRGIRLRPLTSLTK